MEMNLILALSALLICTTEASYFVWKKDANPKVKPTTCKLQALTEQALVWSFSASLSCNADEIVDIHAGEGATDAAVGLECAFTYSCPLDPPGPHRRSALVCGDNGKWEGVMPDCSHDENLAQAILHAFREGLMLPEATEEPKAIQETEETEEVVTTTPVTELETSSVTKSIQSLEVMSKLTSLCNPKDLCSKLRSIRDCKNIKPRTQRPRPSTAFNKMSSGLCYFCYKTQCKRSTILL